jgi:hypothetical protein
LQSSPNSSGRIISTNKSVVHPSLRRESFVIRGHAQTQDAVIAGIYRAASSVLGLSLIPQKINKQTFSSLKSQSFPLDYNERGHVKRLRILFEFRIMRTKAFAPGWNCGSMYQKELRGPPFH